jgi:hypothetical protein
MTILLFIFGFVMGTACGGVFGHIFGDALLAIFWGRV